MHTKPLLANDKQRIHRDFETHRTQPNKGNEMQRFTKQERYRMILELWLLSRNKT